MLLGVRVPNNTIRNNLNALRELAKLSLCNIATQEADWKTEAEMLYRAQWFIFLLQSLAVIRQKVLNNSRMICLYTFVLCSSSLQHSTRTPKPMQNLLHPLCAIASQVCNVYLGKSGVKILKLLSGPIFSCPTNGIYAVVDNKLQNNIVRMYILHCTMY